MKQSAKDDIRQSPSRSMRSQKLKVKVGKSHSPKRSSKRLDGPVCKNCGKYEKTISRLLRDQRAVPPKQRYFDETWVSARLGVSKKTLQSWRLKGEELNYYKFSAAIRYRLRDIIAYEKNSRQSSTSSAMREGTPIL